jgi:hypothetical protein
MIENLMSVLSKAFYKTSLYSRRKDAVIKDFNFGILIYFNSPIIEHLNPLTPNTSYFPHSFIELNNFCKIGGVQMFFEL